MNLIETPIDNSRYEVRKFPIKCDSMLHGFAGYFETVLYKDVMLSINPATHSPGMFSWFPVLFPIQNPISLKKVTFSCLSNTAGTNVDNFFVFFEIRETISRFTFGVASIALTSGTNGA
jgi:hypothetical protein